MNLVSRKDVKVVAQRSLSADFPGQNFGGQEIKEEFSDSRDKASVSALFLCS